MKLVKKVLLGLLMLVIVLAAGSLLISSRQRVERTLEVAAPANAAFEQVNTLRNWERWSPWHGIDPHMLLTYSGPDVGAGASYNWFSQHPDVGDGEFKILKTEPYKFILAEMNFGPNGTARTSYTFDETSNGTRITWAMESEMGMNPLNKYFGLLFLDNMVGPDFERGLNNIKQIVEAQPAVGQQNPHAGHSY